MTKFTLTTCDKVKRELIEAGWTQVATTSSTGEGVRYGVQFIKDGKVYFLNEHTYISGMSGDQMATACLPIFN